MTTTSVTAYPIFKDGTKKYLHMQVHDFKLQYGKLMEAILFMLNDDDDNECVGIEYNVNLPKKDEPITKVIMREGYKTRTYNLTNPDKDELHDLIDIHPKIKIHLG